MYNAKHDLHTTSSVVWDLTADIWLLSAYNAVVLSTMKLLALRFIANYWSEIYHRPRVIQVAERYSRLSKDAEEDVIMHKIQRHTDSQAETDREEGRDIYMLVRSLGAKWKFAAFSTSNKHVVDLTVERQRQSVWTAVSVCLSATHHERAILRTAEHHHHRSCVVTAIRGRGFVHTGVEVDFLSPAPCWQLGNKKSTSTSKLVWPGLKWAAGFWYVCHGP